MRTVVYWRHGSETWEVAYDLRADPDPNSATVGQLLGFTAQVMHRNPVAFIERGTDLWDLPVWYEVHQ